ncbi:hypothetical protein [Methylophaga sp. OBS3]|uniref:hypothetical protein n=1 Tax=Methylophaga sp. OBS3 TaxID=2991934 RepID=UPI00225803F4|nr:hypothetical protein [Methylophaga sp. OBS3]MCX4189278.1 hypothetical protein [Methylophaga sp. OBS3]
MKKVVITASLTVLMSLPIFAQAEANKIPGDMPAEAQQQMSAHITGYNKCMMESRLRASQNGQDAQQNADEIMSSCETHLDELEALLAENEVDENLTQGMKKSLRSRAARQLMARTMNNLAAQAAAASNAEPAAE